MAKCHAAGGPDSWEEDDCGQKRTALAGRRLLAADRRHTLCVCLVFVIRQMRFICRYLYEYKASAARNEAAAPAYERQKVRFAQGL